MARSGTRTLTPQIARRLAGQRMTRGASASLADPNPDMLTMQYAAEIANGLVLGDRIYETLRSHQALLDEPPPALKLVRDAVAVKIVDEYALAGGMYEQALAGLHGANNAPDIVHLMKDRSGVWHLIPDIGSNRPACADTIDGNPSILEQKTWHVDMLRRHSLWQDEAIWCDNCRDEVNNRLAQFHGGLLRQDVRSELANVIASGLGDALVGQGDPVPRLFEPLPPLIAGQIYDLTGNRPVDWLRHCAPNNAFYNNAVEVYASRAGGPTVIHDWDRHAAAQAAVSRMLQPGEPVDLYALVEEEILPTLILETWLDALAEFPAYLKKHGLSEHKHIVNSPVTFALRKMLATLHERDGVKCFVSPAGRVLEIPEQLLGTFF